MADDALTRKEAEMGRLTREDIESWRMSFKSTYPETVVSYTEARRQLDILCDLALRALSLESVREEAELDSVVLARNETLEEAAKACDGIQEREQKYIISLRVSGIGVAKDCAKAIRALQHGDQHAPARVAEVDERAICTLCSSEPSVGFYTGCMIQDGAAKQTGWNCDGKGNLTRFPSAPESPAKEQPGEQNAAPQADLGPETDGTLDRSASGSPGGGAVHPDAEARAWGSEPGGASDRGARAGNVVARPAAAAP